MKTKDRAANVDNTLDNTYKPIQYLGILRLKCCAKLLYDAMQC
jgi:hypothetical protein